MLRLHRSHTGLLEMSLCRLPKEHDEKWFLMTDTCSHHRPAHQPTARWWAESGALGVSVSHPSDRRGGRKSERCGSQMSLRKQHFPGTTKHTGSYMNSQTVTRKTYTSHKIIPSTKEGQWAQSGTPTEEMIQRYPKGEGGGQFPPRQRHTPGGPCSRAAGQHRSDSINLGAFCLSFHFFKEGKNI